MIRRGAAIASLMIIAGCRPHEPRASSTLDSTRLRQYALARRQGDSAQQVLDSLAELEAAWQGDSGLVVWFVMQGGVREPRLDPFLIIDSTRAFRSPPVDHGDVPIVAFNQRWYSRQQRYRRLVAGAPAGTVVAGVPSVQGCVGLSARSHFEGDEGPDSGGLATSDTRFSPRAFMLRAPTAAESTTVRSLALAAAATDSAWPDAPTHLKPRRLIAITGGAPDSPLLLGVYFGFASSDSTPDHEGREISLIVLAEQHEGSYRTAWQIVGAGTEESSSEHQFVDVVDLDGDGWPELVIANQYYETNDYAIVSRRGGKWSTVYRGGGGGC